MNFNPTQFLGGAGGLFGGLFGNTDKPYDEAIKSYQPYSNAGTNALNSYQEWLNGQKDPAKFINDQMKNYNESDYAHNLTNQSMRAGQNAASASGLSGSTPLMEQLQQNAGQIASADQNQWLQNVLGINTQYGQGQNNLVNTGFNAAGKVAEQNYNKGAAHQNNFWNNIGSAASMIGAFL